MHPLTRSPVLTAADEDPEAAAGAAAAVSTQPLEETVSVPVQQPAEPVAQPVVSQDALRAPTVQRRKPEVDPAVEAVINITPLDGSFDIRLLKQRIADIEAEPLLKDLVRVQCFDKVSGLWYDGADRVTECTQIYLSMLLANRSRCVDQPTASKFMIHAEQFAIELKGESETPDSNEMIQGAERIQRIIQAFDKRLCVKLVAAKDIGEEELDAAAKACGFVKESDRYQRYVPGISTAVFHILPPQALGNEIELSFEVPLMAPASDPLSQFFAIANDLCCRNCELFVLCIIYRRTYLSVYINTNQSVIFFYTNDHRFCCIGNNCISCCCHTVYREIRMSFRINSEFISISLLYKDNASVCCLNLCCYCESVGSFYAAVFSTDLAIASLYSFFLCNLILCIVWI